MRYGDGIVMIGNEIVECEVGCDPCDSEDPAICNRCSSRLYLDVDKKCKKCNINCLRCSSFETCEECALNTQKLADGSCKRCEGNCK